MTARFDDRLFVFLEAELNLHKKRNLIIGIAVGCSVVAITILFGILWYMFCSKKEGIFPFFISEVVN